MFDFVRHHTKLFMVVLFVLVFPAFALWGIGGYSRMGSSAKVAVVDGQSITQADWDQAHRLHTEQLRRSNPSMNVALLDTPQMRYATLEGLVRERVLAVAVQKQRLLVSDVALAEALQSDPTIASLRKDDGTLDMAAYERLAAQQGLTPQGFEEGVRAQIARQQVLGSVVDTSFASQSTAQLALNAFAERREVRLQRFDPKDFKDKVKVSDAELEEFYKQNPSHAPESADIEYVVLSAEDLKTGLTPSEDELRSYYEQNAATLGAPEERRAAHILINAPKDAPAAERDAARQKAQELLDEVTKAPDTFAAVARRASQDDVSAPSGGDLGRFVQGRDSGLDAALTAAIFAIEKEGGISPLVESDYGWHILRLTSLKPATVPSFEQARERIADAWRAQEAPRRYNEAAEEFRNIVYEQPDSLQPVAERFGLKVQTAQGITRTPAPGATAPLNDARLLAALFASDSLDKKHNTEAQEVGSQQLVSARVTKHTPAHTLPLAEVREQALAALTAQRTAELAAHEGARQLKALQDGGSDKALGSATTISRTAPGTLPPQAVEAILRADPAKLPATIGVPLGGAGYLIARVEKILPPEESDAAELASTRQLYEQAWAASEAQSYYELLRQQYKAQILAPRPSADATE